jgi:hypothetical protein
MDACRGHRWVEINACFQEMDPIVDKLTGCGDSCDGRAVACEGDAVALPRAEAVLLSAGQRVRSLYARLFYPVDSIKAHRSAFRCNGDGP